MSFYYYITCEVDLEDEENPIDQVDWDEIVQMDPELRHPTAEEMNSEFASENDVIWTKHPAQELIWFVRFSGNIAAKWPDEATLSKMVEIARKLNANIIDENDDLYFSSADSSGSPTLNYALRSKRSRDEPKAGLIERIFAWSWYVVFLILFGILAVLMIRLAIQEWF